jgi:hypothetical protein
MTESEWLACADPTHMLEYLRGTSSDRKLRLLACACYRRLWHVLTDLYGRWLVERTEQWADDQIDPEDLLTLQAEERLLMLALDFEGSAPMAAVFAILESAADAAAQSVAWTTRGASDQLGGSEPAESASALVRDIFGNPFHPCHANPGWRRWQDGAVVHRAQVIYDERRFQDLPFLADALEEAGCIDPDILGHCRRPGEHVRGCWVVDLILGKE